MDAFAPSPWPVHLIVALAWLSFGAAHSVLAATPVKQRLAPLFGVYYRLAYNLFAALHIGLVMALGGIMLSAQSYVFEPGISAAMTGIKILGAIVLLLALRQYDLGRFSGLSQIRAHRQGKTDPGDEPLVIQGIHQFVRHPLYLGAILYLWGGANAEFGLLTAVWGSLYLWIGGRHEERSLLALYGPAYTAYRAKVPAILPWKGRLP